MNRRFRGIRVLVLSVLAFPATGCVVYPFRSEVEVSQVASFEGVNKVVVETRNGGIEVRCDAARKDVQIHAVKHANGATLDDARTHAEEIEITAQKDAADPGVLRIAAHFPSEDWGRSRGARFELALPPEAALQLETGNGRVSAEGCRKDVLVRTRNGSIDVRNVEGGLDAETSNGRIEARDVRGDVAVETSNGGIELDRVGNQSVRARSTNGHIRITEGRGAANVRTSNGSIDLRLASVPKSPRIEAVTSNGRIDVEIPSDINARLDMQTTNGRIRTSLDNVKMSDFESGRSHLRATLNEGTGQMDIQSSNGSITLRSTGAKPMVSIGWEEGIEIHDPGVVVTVD